jgi:hypothetical protein
VQHKVARIIKNCKNNHKNKERVIMHSIYRHTVRLTGLAILVSVAQAYDAYSRSYLATHTPFDTLSPECISLFHNRMDLKKDGHKGAGELVLFGGQTTQPHTIAQYLLPNGKNTIIVAEDTSNAAISHTRDVNAGYFDIITGRVWTNAELVIDFTNLTFESIVQFCPQQTLYGVGLAWQQRLPKRFWFDITIPIVRARNKLCMTETITNKGGSCQECTYHDTTYFNNFIDGACCNSNGRLYGNMTNKCLQKTRVAHIDIRGGRDFDCANNCCNLSGYLGIMIPTGNKPCNIWLFEPIVGDSHVGIEMGTWASFKLLDDGQQHTLTAYLSGLTRYLLPNNQYRSFDVRGKPWSRYMWVWVNDNYGQVATIKEALQDNRSYLINYSTLCVRVRPHYSYEVNSGLDYAHKGFHAEIGFNFYGKKAEEICFTHAMNNGIGIAAMRYYLDNPDQPLATSSLATINSPLFKIGHIQARADEVVNLNPAQINNQANYIPLTTDDLDPLSGAQPEIMSQTIYGALAYSWDHIKHPVLLSGGASYEFSHGNAAVTRWIGWLKVGISI